MKEHALKEPKHYQESFLDAKLIYPRGFIHLLSCNFPSHNTHFVDSIMPKGNDKQTKKTNKKQNKSKTTNILYTFQIKKNKQKKNLFSLFAFCTNQCQTIQCHTNATQFFSEN